jgi:hypothetical protein
MKLINDWTPETRSLLKTLQAHGLTIVKVDNGEAETPFAGTSLADFIAEATACDEARLYVKTPSGETRSLYLVFGNSPGELVCDHGVDPLVEAAVDEHYNQWDGRKQPVCESPY